MSRPDNRTPEELATVAREEVFINIKTVWAEVQARWPQFVKTRTDQATREDTVKRKSSERVKIEIRYGSRTVRVLMLHGDRVLGLWDLQTNGARDRLDAFLDDELTPVIEKAAEL